MLILKSARATTDVGSLASAYLNEPGYMLGRLMIETVKGVLNALVMAWAVPFYNQTMTANPTNLLVSFLLALLAVGIFLVFLRLLGGKNDLRAESAEGVCWCMEKQIWLQLAWRARSQRQHY